MPSPVKIPPAAAQAPQTGSILLLAAAGFASQAQARVTDSLLPQIATDFQTTVGVAAIVVTAYAVTHGTIQFVAGPIADRFGKYPTVAVASALASVLVACCGLATSLPQLGLARLATGAVAGWVIPISMAYVGDVTPYDRRQPVLARYASGYILGQLFGQAIGGVLGDLLGWRSVFFVLAGMFALAAAGLVFELVTNPQTRTPAGSGKAPGGFVADYRAVLSNPFARIILAVGFLEAALAWGAFAYIGADLHVRFGVSFTLVGLTVAFFGIGGLIYAGLVKSLIYRLGQTGLDHRRRVRARRGLRSAGNRNRVVARAGRNNDDRARLLHVPQHAADQRHADDAGSARHRRRRSSRRRSISDRPQEWAPARC